MEHHATILWRRTSESFTYDSYNRAHEWRFHSVTVPASAAPGFRGDATMVNPEEAFVASLSSCHMLTFLALAAKKRFSLFRQPTWTVCTIKPTKAASLPIR